MTNLALIYAQEDRAYVQQVRGELEGKGYTILQEQDPHSLQAIIHPRPSPYTILGAAAVVLVWSMHAQSSSGVAQQLALMQQLRKAIFPLFVDATPLVLAGNTLQSTLPQDEALRTLLSKLPPPANTDPFHLLCEQAISDDRSKRRDAIEQAGQLFQDGQYRDEIKALLACIADNDRFTSIQDQARTMFNRLQGNSAYPSSPASAGDPFKFGLKCKNGHISYFDKRDICREKRTDIYRLTPFLSPGKSKKERFLLSCNHEGCGEKMEYELDCEGLR